MLEKTKLDTAEVLIFKALIDSNISNDEFALINIVLKEYDNIKKETKNSDNIKCFFIVLNI